MSALGGFRFITKFIIFQVSDGSRKSGKRGVAFCCQYGRRMERGFKHALPGKFRDLGAQRVHFVAFSDTKN